MADAAKQHARAAKTLLTWRVIVIGKLSLFDFVGVRR
jgi:hypothetical protein